MELNLEKGIKKIKTDIADTYYEEGMILNAWKRNIVDYDDCEKRIKSIKLWRDELTRRLKVEREFVEIVRGRYSRKSA